MKKFIKKSLIILVIASFVAITHGCAVIPNVSDTPKTSYQISLTMQSSPKSYIGECNVNYTHQDENTLTKMAFNLYPNALKGHGSKMNITSITIDGVQVGFSQSGKNGEILYVNLLEELFPNESVNLCIKYDLTLPEIDGRYGISGETVRLSTFYPSLCVIDRGEWQESKSCTVGDYFYSEKANFEVRITLPYDYQVASSGKRVSTTKSDEVITHTYKGDNVRDFAMCLSTKYHTVSAVYGSTLITAYAFSEEESEKVIEIAQKSFSLYCDKYGKYSHQTFCITLCELDCGGMEYDGIVYVDRTLKDMELERVIAHEIAHEWWYAGVGSNPIKYAWLDEGLAEHSTLEYIEKYYGVEQREKIVSDANSSYVAFTNALKSIRGIADYPMSQDLDKFSSLYEYVTVTYTKGLLFFENLSSIVGKKKFDEGLKKYYSIFNGKIAEPQDLCECLTQHGKINLEPVFHAWESGKVYFGT